MNCSLPLSVLAAAVFMTLPPQLSAQQSLPKASAGEIAVVSARVIAVDQDAREVVLEGRNGQTRTLVLGPEVKNLAQVKPGDVVKATYEQAVAIELKKGGSAIPSERVKEEASGAPLGEKPSGVARRQVTLTGRVEEVDAASRLVSVKGPKGNVVDVGVSPQTLAEVKVGDEVELVYTEALAIAVTAGAN